MQIARQELSHIASVIHDALSFFEYFETRILNQQKSSIIAWQ